MRRVRTLSLLACALTCAFVLALGAGPARAASFDPDDVLSDEVMHASGSMSQADVQAFLEAMPGVLDTYSSADHSGSVKPAAQIISEAGTAWGVSPKLLLALLQKEQSLLTLRHPTEARLAKAVGCGVYPGSKNRYEGFGNQLWHAARKLAAYPQLYHYKPGVKKSVYGKKSVHPANAATFSMYTYNPSINGNRNWWTIYQRYFGDPHERVWRKPIYRFRDVQTGERLYTGSEGVRWSFAVSESVDATAEGIGFTIDALPGALRQGGSTVTADSSAGTPVYAVFDRRIGSWLYTPSQAEADAIVARRPERYEARGVAFGVVR
jgi:hypothetical protein